MSIETEATSAVQKTESFFNSSAFHNHIRTWTFVLLALVAVVFLYVHESNVTAAQNALAQQIISEQTAQQQNIDKQIQALHADTQSQVQEIQKQIQQAQTVAQAIATIKASIPPVSITPIVTQPATSTAPAKTTADVQATGDLPVATVTGGDLKLISETVLGCKAQAIELTSCKQDVALEQKKSASLQTEVDGLKKVKLPPVWKRTITTIGHVALGILVGKAL